MSQTDRIAGLVGNSAIKVPCKSASTAALTLSGEQTVDGVALVTGDRVLVKNQSTGSQNGIYVVDTGDWNLAEDADGPYDWTEGSLIFVTDGSTTVGFWYLTTAGDIVPGTTSLTFAQASSVLAVISAYTQTLLPLASAAAWLSALGALSDAAGEVDTANLADNAVTYAKMQNISATARILGRKTSGAGDPEECTLSEILDFIGSAAQGDILYRGASAWARLAAGTSGHFLKTLGAGANPEWAAAGGLTFGTPVNFSGSAIGATGIPSTARMLAIPFSGMSSNGSTNIVFKVGPSGGVVSTGYGGSQYNWTGAASAISTSFLLRQTGASSVGNGIIFLVCLNTSTNTWLAIWEIGGSDTAQGYTGAGTITLSGALERYEFSCGADSFDAGSFNHLILGA